MFTKLLRRRARGDSGAAMVTTILVMVVITGMGSVVVQVASANLRNAGRDRVAGGALGAAEAGLAAAHAYLSGNGMAALACSPTCSTNPWGNEVAPKEISVGSQGAKAKVWILLKQKLDPANKIRVATYVINSTGLAGKTGATGSVTLAQTVDVKPLSFPIGVYADNVGSAGSASVHYESFFTKGCVNMRSHMTFEPPGALDLWYGMPAGVHSTQYITDSNNGCGATDIKNIHKTGPCNPAYPYDRDAQGGAVSETSPCATAGGVKTSPDTPSTKFTTEDLEKTIGLQPRGLKPTDYAALKLKAQAQGQYYTTTAFTPPDPATYPNAVMYFKLSAGQSVNIGNELNAFGSSTCGSRSLVIVVEGGDLHTNAGLNITAAVFVPDGTYRGNGSGQVHGTLYAKYIEKFNGTADFYLEQCFFDNMPGGLLDLQPRRFKVEDRG